MESFEKLGAFYLGRLFDPAKQAVSDDLLLYDAKDLTTHAVCVGMTGSGKTGLCLSLLEEAAIDGIPAIAIDPKGDLANLLLTFPELRPDDFRPWIDPGEAARKGQSAEEYAKTVANLWRKGLADWGQDGERIARFREAVDLAVYTPGSSAGLPLSVLRSLSAPGAALLADGDAVRERIQATVSGLLALLGLDADPIRSREHILLSKLLQRAWEAGSDLELATLIREIQSPPLERVGVLDLETFFPSRERAGLAMSLNNLLASPGFAAWMEGEPLQVPRLLWTPEGKPRIAILSIAHLSESERMFFVTLLLNEVVAWMRTQPGSTSLRALLYMDEVFGYFPPTANPPSKTPMLTLLKQARAYGLGVVLATQNPVDLDYKGLSNTGTWFLGRLQTERDKARVLEGLEGASATTGTKFDRQSMEATLAGLKSRVFLMNNVHDDAPALFHTRWALSYLRGPLTRSQIRQLVAERPPEASAPASATQAPPSIERPAEVAAAKKVDRPALPAEVIQLFQTSTVDAEAGDRMVYRPALLGTATLHFVSARDGVDSWEQTAVLAALRPRMTGSVWEGGEPVEGELPRFDNEALPGASYSELPPAATRAKSYSSWSKSLKTFLYRQRTVAVWKCRELKETSLPGETEGEFRVRLGQQAREARDLQLSKLEKRYAPKLARIKEAARKVELRIERERSQYGQQKLQTAISVGATVLGALFGRKVTSVGTVGRATTAVRGAGRAARERDDIARATADLEAQQKKLQDLEEEFAEEMAAVREGADPSSLTLESKEIRPRKSDLVVERVALVWRPWRIGADGIAEPAFD